MLSQAFFNTDKHSEELYSLVNDEYNGSIKKSRCLTYKIPIYIIAWNRFEFNFLDFFTLYGKQVHVSQLVTDTNI